MNLEIMGKIDADYNVSNTSDPEVKQRWFPLGIKLGYNITDKAKEFV
jgi:leukotriene-A4 hydrolase